jgi:hypothetical protein
MKETRMAHIVLLGDSIFDNAPYVPAGMHVQAQLQTLVAPHRVSLLARDGDVLGLVSAMQSKAGSVIEAATLLADWQAGFRRDYRRMLNVVLSRRKPVAVSPIEPSGQGGGKIAAAIAQLVRVHDPAAPQTVVYAGALS